LAIELQTILLIDEKMARSAVRKLNLKIIGTAGVLFLAKKRKVIDAVLPIIKKTERSRVLFIRRINSRDL
jgi:predicted nucleic acid-binding protein